MVLGLIASSNEAVGWGDLASAVLVATLACLPLGISVWALLDAARRPRWVWAMTKHPQTIWMAAVAVGVLLTVFGLGISLWYLLRVRPTLAAIERGDLGHDLV